jgi:hypothetical protein
LFVTSRFDRFFEIIACEFESNVLVQVDPEANTPSIMDVSHRIRVRAPEVDVTAGFIAFLRNTGGSQ